MERRRYPRIPLDMPYFLFLALADMPTLHVMLVDLSCGGLQASLPPEWHMPQDFLGKHGTIHNLPGKEGFTPTGSISWASSERCGVRFDAPLPFTSAALRDIIQRL